MEREKIKGALALMLILILCMSQATAAFAEQQAINIKGKPLKGFDKTCIGSATGNKYTGSTDKLYVNGEIAFCIQSGYKIQGFAPSGEDEKELIYDVSEIAEGDSLQNKIAYLGWHNSRKTDKDYAFTQMYIWRSLPDIPASGNSTVKFVSGRLNDEYKEWKKGIDKTIESWDKKPSFDYGTCKKAIEISAGETKEIADGNGVLADYKTFSYTDGGITVSHEKGNNVLIVKAAENCLEEEVDMNASLLRKAGGYKFDMTSAASYIYEHEKSQNIATYAPGFIEPVSMDLRFNVDIAEGRIAIEKTKSPDAASDEIMPEEGAEFQVYLKSAGSYAASPSERRDIIITGRDGKAVTKDLPHGTYIVHQTEGAEGHKLVGDFEVTIGTDSHDRVYTYKLNNDTLQSKLKIVKKDAETGKTIPFAGVRFEIVSLTTGEQIKSDSEDGCFETDGRGEAKLPFPLYYGEYRLSEKKAPEGYILLARPIDFTVDGGEETVTIEVRDMPQKGIIKIHKTGEILMSVKENENGTYTPVFGSENMGGAEFEVRAAEDIATPDGTVRVKKGEIVDKLVTDSEGSAQTGLQYLGKYSIVEIKAPHGHILDETVYRVELVYAGQEVEITDTSLQLDNERQKAEIRFAKAIEEDELFGMDSEAEYKEVRFGLFAGEDIIAADGSHIPKDGLIEATGIRPVEENGDGGKIVYGDTLHGVGKPYTKEALKTNSGSPEADDEAMEPDESSAEYAGNAKYTEYTGEFTTDIPFAKLYVKEIAADGRYISKDVEYPVEFSYQGQDVAIVDIDVNDGKPIKNELKRGKIIGRKADDKNEPLAGAVFGLFRPDAESFGKENALMASETDENGIFEFYGVPKGKWVIREIAAPRGYLLSNEIYEAVIEEDCQTIEITAINKPKTGYARFFHDVDMMKKVICLPVKTEDEAKIMTWIVLIIFSVAVMAISASGKSALTRERGNEK